MRMYKILSADAVSTGLLVQPRGWFEAEWDSVDPFEGDHPRLVVPSPIVAVDDQGALAGGLAFTSAPRPGGGAIAVWLNVLLVAPGHRRKGIASKLVQAAELNAARLGIGKLFVRTEFSSLYQQLGWLDLGSTTADGQTNLSRSIAVG